MYATGQRAAAVDFTRSFLQVQATLLLRKPSYQTEFKIRSVNDLLYQSEIRYGTINHGVIVRAFKRTNDTTLRVLWRRMQAFEPSAFTSTNQEGIDRARSERYAFILPHTTGEYMTMQQPCDLLVVDRFLMNRGYHLGLQKGSPLLGRINEALDILEHSGRLDSLYRKWWLGQNRCNGPREDSMYSAHSLENASSAADISHVWITVFYIVYLFYV